MAAGTLVLLLGQLNGYVSAATPPPSTTKPDTNALNNNANSAKISPLRSDLTLIPGTSGTVKTYITNLTNNTVIFKAIENDFVAGDEKVTPSLILDENSY